MLVILRINRAATCVCWSPKGNCNSFHNTTFRIAVRDYDIGFWTSKLFMRYTRDKAGMYGESSSSSSLVKL